MTFGYRKCRCRLGTCYCVDDNVGQLGVDLEGDLTIGIGGGLAVDVEDGDIVMDIPGTDIGFDL